MKRILILLLTGLTLATSACGNLPELQADIGNSGAASATSDSIIGEQIVNTETTVGEVIANPAFEDLKCSPFVRQCGIIEIYRYEI